MLMSMRFFASILMEVMYKLISKIFSMSLSQFREQALTHSTSGEYFLRCFVAMLQGQMHSDDAFFFLLMLELSNTMKLF